MFLEITPPPLGYPVQVGDQGRHSIFSGGTEISQAKRSEAPNLRVLIIKELSQLGHSRFGGLIHTSQMLIILSIVSSGSLVANVSSSLSMEEICLPDFPLPSLSSLPSLP